MESRSAKLHRMDSSPSTISELDDNDDDELQASDANAGALMDPNSMVHAGMFLSLLHQVCSAYEKDCNKQDKMFHLICQQMSKLNLIPSQHVIDTFSAMKAIYTKAFRQMMHGTLQHIEQADMEPRMLSLPATEQERTAVFLQMQNPLLRLPRITQEEIIYSKTTRYQTDYEELGLLGKGGFGKVYKVCCRLDQRFYAVKKIKLKETNINKSYKLVKEVQLLASLKHPNVVGYNTSWIEYEPMKGNSTYQEVSRQNLIPTVRCLPCSSSESPRSSSEQESSTTDKNKVKIEDLGNKGELSPQIRTNCANMSPLSQNAGPLNADSLASSSSRLSRSPGDSTSTLVASPTTPDLSCCQDASHDKVDTSPDLRTSFKETCVSQKSSTFTATSESSYSTCFSMATSSTTETKTATSNTHIERDSRHQTSFSQSVSTEHRSFQSASKTTELESYSYDLDSLSGNDIQYNSESMNANFEDEESSDYQIFFENDPAESQSDVLDRNGSVHMGPDGESRNLISSALKLATTIRSNNYMASQNKTSLLYPKDVKRGTFGFTLPCIHSSRSEVQTQKIQSKCKIVSLDDMPVHETKASASKKNRRRHRSKSEDDINDQHKPRTRTLSTVPPMHSFPMYIQMVLYIQMQLCSHTLADWLKKRNTKTDEVRHSLDRVSMNDNLHIFKQILDGIQYIHSQGLIHRDLKPKNIFLEESSSNLQVLIGDFGLAKEDFVVEQVPPDSGLNIPTPDHPHRVWADPCKPASHTADVGTKTYASPEQLKGSKYDCKSDMYSSGIILFEMFHPFTTQMERYIVIEQVRQGCIPHEINKRWPDQYKTIGQLTHTNSCHRPNASEVLKGPLFLSKDEVIKDLRRQLSEKDAEIQKLMQKLAKLEKELSKR